MPYMVVPNGILGISTTVSDWNVRQMSSEFGYEPGGPDRQIQPNHERGGAYCQRTGIWYPTSMLRKDGLGRTVGVDNDTPGRPLLPS